MGSTALNPNDYNHVQLLSPNVRTMFMKVPNVRTVSTPAIIFVSACEPSK